MHQIPIIDTEKPLYRFYSSRAQGKWVKIKKSENSGDAQFGPLSGNDI